MKVIINLVQTNSHPEKIACTAEIKKKKNFQEEIIKKKMDCTVTRQCFKIHSIKPSEYVQCKTY